MVSVASLLAWWRQLPVERTSGRRKLDFLLILRAYYRTGQLEERDWCYVLWVPEEGPRQPDADSIWSSSFEYSQWVWWDQGGFFTVDYKIVPPNFNILKMIVRQSQDEQALWRLFRYQLQSSIVYYLSSFNGAMTTDGSLLARMLTRAGVQPMSRIHKATQQDYARLWTVMWTIYPHLIDLAAYIHTRSFQDRHAMEALKKTYIEPFVNNRFYGPPEDVIGGWYHQFLQRILQNYLRMGQMVLRLEETNIEHPILGVVTSAVSLSHWDIGGATLTTMQQLISNYAGRAPNYPEVMQRLQEQALLQSS